MLRKITTSVLVGALTLASLSVSLGADDYGLPSLGSGGSSVSSDEEHRLGRAWLRQFRAQTQAWQDPITQRYVESVLSRLLPYSDIGTTQVIVTLVDSRLLNAFAVPGGIVGVNAGLFSFASSKMPSPRCWHTNSAICPSVISRGAWSVSKKLSYPPWPPCWQAW
ncbi:hypothetical protein [Halomonas sp. PR-M31]|uniref:hypothetical protein n=1 Tax=Halomonas sp. PR-M31 TaxID=1471202 RepID=UPI003460D8A5